MTKCEVWSNQEAQSLANAVGISHKSSRCLQQLDSWVTMKGWDWVMRTLGQTKPIFMSKLDYDGLIWKKNQGS